MARTKEITCPSGLCGVAREFKLREEEFLADKKLIKSGGAVTKLLNACWLETKDFGPYPKADVFHWDQALASDRTHAFIQMRILALGAEYTFRVKCRGCPKTYAWSLQLTDLPVDPSSQAVKEYLKIGEPLICKLSDERIVKWRPLIGEDERFLNNLDSAETDKTTSRYIAQRVIDFNGVTNKSELISLVEDISIEDSDTLLDTFDNEEGGVDTLFDVECGFCGTVQQITLPFEESFYSKRRRFARTRRRAG